MFGSDARREDEAIPKASLMILAMLTFAMTMSYCDRYVLNLVIEPIKRDLALSDTAVAVVQGFAFAMFFVVSGVPLGIQVDRRRRLTIIALGVLLWSLATCACGLVTNFGELLGCRIAVAVGEATLTPAAFSIFADIFPRQRLGFAAGIFSLGIYLGAGLAFFGGAALLAHFDATGGVNLPFLGRVRDWQVLFILVGLPGAPLALWIATLREPPRTGIRRDDISHGLFEDLLVFVQARRRMLLALFLCAGFAALTSQAYAAWIPSYLIRSFGWSVPQAAGVSGMVILVGGLAGVLTAGVVGDAFRRQGRENGRLIVMIASGLAAAPLASAAPLVGNVRVALSLTLLVMFLTTVLLTSAAPAIQELLPNRIQGTIIAIYALVVTLIGLGLGPMAVALMSDYVLGDERRIGEGLAAVSLLSMSASVVLGWSAWTPYSACLAQPDKPGRL